MIVYIVTRTYDYENSQILAVCAHFLDAQKYMYEEASSSNQNLHELNAKIDKIILRGETLAIEEWTVHESY